MQIKISLLCLAILFLKLPFFALLPNTVLAEETPAERGYRYLTEKAYLPLDFDENDLAEVWKVWPEPLRTEAEKATPARRREMAFTRYGFHVRPGDAAAPDLKRRPLQYVVEENGEWKMNCFACHGGAVLGKTIPGLANSDYQLQTLTEEMRLSKIRRGKGLARLDIGAMFMPLGGNRGQSNAVMFGVVLLSFRDAELNVHPKRVPPKLTHHDMDPPAWWHFKRKKQIYIDGFAPKDHRALMQFMLVKENGPEKFREWEDDYRDVYAWLESLEAPKYPGKIDAKLAVEGERVFKQSCAKCHGTYGEDGDYPEKMVDIEDVQTDAVRLKALTPANRAHYAKTWFAESTRERVVSDPVGYVAPPLDGVWATAPYLHNGSTPTLWHMLHPEKRPTYWRRTGVGEYDHNRIGLKVDEFESMPTDAKAAIEKREVFNTNGFGKSAKGHDYPAALSETEKRALLEYLKTL